MTFWNRLRLAGTVIVLAIAMLVLLDDLLNRPSGDSPDANAVPRLSQPSDSLRLPHGTSGQ